MTIAHNDTEVIFETDVDWVGEILAADAEAEERIQAELDAMNEYWDCCAGRDPFCGHYRWRGFMPVKRPVFSPDL